MMKILVDRRIGGFGDLMVLSVALDMLSRDNQVGLVLQEKYHCLFKNWPIKLMTVPTGEWDTIVNIHNPCPAGAIEVAALAATRINQNKMARGLVQSTRIEAFAVALDVDVPLDEVTPVVKLSGDDRRWAADYVSKMKRPIVYVQADSAEEYKSWPSFQYLCADLEEEEDCSVIASGRCGDRQSISVDILRAVALMEVSDLVVSVDSMAVHGAAAVGTPSVLISGPMNAGARIGTYPYASSVSLMMECAPCWRNQGIPCHVHGESDSLCLTNLPICEVLRHVVRRLGEIGSGSKRPSLKYDEIDTSRSWSQTR